MTIPLDRLRDDYEPYGSGVIALTMGELGLLLAVVEAAREADTVYELVRKGIASEDDLLDVLYAVRLKLAPLTAAQPEGAPDDR